MTLVPRRFSMVALAAPLLTCGCVVGPNFKPPAPPPVSSYTPKPPETTAAAPDVTGGEPQHFVTGTDIPADWWTLFHSQALNALIEQALANNADLKAAQAALLVAHENTLAQHGAYLPQVSAGGDDHAPEGSVGDACSRAGEQFASPTRWSRRSSACPTCPTSSG